MRSVGFGGPHEHGWLGSLRATFGAGSLVQFVSALAGFASIPILVSHLGSAEFGVLIVITSLAPWLTLLDGAIQPTTRLLVGESRGAGAPRASGGLLSASKRIAVRIALVNVLVVAACLVVLPIMRWFGASGVVTLPTLVLAISAFCLVVLASSPGTVYMGALEGVGRGVAAAAISGSGPLLALPLTFIAAERGAGLVTFSAIQGLSVAAPRYLAWIYWAWKPSLLDESSTGSSSPLRLALLAQMGLLGALNLVQSGLDPMVVASALGADAAAEYGLAWRITGGALIPLAILAPLIGSNIAAARGRGWNAARDRELVWLTSAAAAAGVLAGLLVAVLGPLLANLLGGGEIGTPQSLYWASGAFVAVSYASQPLYLAFMGPAGLKFSVRMNVLLAAGNLSASLVLVRILGPAGPMWASAVAGLLALLSWVVVWLRRRTWLSEVHSA